MPSHFRGPLLAAGTGSGLFENLLIEATKGASDVVTVFDDFNQVFIQESFGDAGHFEPNGWTLTDVGAPAADTIGINGAYAALPYDSCIRINAGTAADTGGNAQLDPIAGGASTIFPHIWLPESGAGAAILDNTIFVFACRIGFISNAATWDGKVFIGMAEAADVGILTAATGEIAQAETGPLVGFHVGENGRIDGISQRTVNTAYAEGTNRTNLYAAGSAAHGTAGLAKWYDLAIRMHITDMSDNAANGSTTFYTRQVGAVTKAPGSPGNPNVTDSLSVWRKHGTILTNQTPNNDVALVPTIEVANGPTNLSDVLVDWWAFGLSRFSRTGR